MLVALPSPLAAQAVHLDGYRAAPSATDGLALSRPTDLGHLRVGARLDLDYALDPLVVEDPVGRSGRERGALVEHLLAAQASLSFGLFDRLVLYAGLPITLAMDGEVIPDEPPPDGGGLGDVRLGARGRIFGEADESFALAAQLTVTVPTAQVAAPRMRFLGEDGATLWPELLAELRLFGGELLVGASLGARVRTTDRARLPAGRLDVSHELTLGLSVRGVAVRDLLELAIEAYGASTFEDLGARATTPIELLFALLFHADPLRFGLAGGVGVARGYGAPDLRALLTLSWSGAIEGEE